MAFALMHLGVWSCPGQDNLLNSKLNVRMGKKGDLAHSSPLQRHSDGRVRIWRKQNENMDPSCLVTTVQAGGGVMRFLGNAHFRPL